MTTEHEPVSDVFKTSFGMQMSAVNSIGMPSKSAETHFSGHFDQNPQLRAIGPGHPDCIQRHVPTRLQPSNNCLTNRPESERLFLAASFPDAEAGVRLD